MSDDVNGIVLKFERPTISAPDTPPIRRTKRPAPVCRHSATEIDERGRKITCCDCGADLDPYQVLAMISREYDRYAEACERAKADAERMTAKLEDLKRQERNARARVKRLRGDEPQ